MRKRDRRESSYTPVSKPASSIHQDHARTIEHIYQDHCQFVRSICRRMLQDPTEAEDATQDVFVRVLLKLHTFRGESALSTWLYRLTTNLVLMRFRSNNHEQVSLDEYLDDGNISQIELGGPDLQLSGALDRIDLQAAIDLLPDGYRAAFILHDVHGYDHREIAELFGYSVGNSKSQLHKARQRLRKLLGVKPNQTSGQESELETVCQR